MALMGADPQRVYIVTSAVGGLMAGLAGALLIFQYSCIRSSAARSARSPS